MSRRRVVLGAVAAAGLVAGSGAASAAGSGPLAQQQTLTVGGWLLDDDGGRIYVAGELPCPPAGDGEVRGIDNPNLRVQTEDGVFHLDTATTSCTGDGRAAGGTLSGTGTGTLDGAPTTIEFRFTDTGDSTRADELSLALGPRGVQGSAAGALEQGSIRMGKTLNHVEATAGR
jgi:hypothetical protein